MSWSLQGKQAAECTFAVFGRPACQAAPYIASQRQAHYSGRAGLRIFRSESTAMGARRLLYWLTTLLLSDLQCPVWCSGLLLYCWPACKPQRGSHRSSCTH